MARSQIKAIVVRSAFEEFSLASFLPYVQVKVNTKRHTAFRDCRVRFSLCLDDLSRNNCILRLHYYAVADTVSNKEREHFILTENANTAWPTL